MISLPTFIADSRILTPAQKEQLSLVDAIPVVDPSFEDDNLKNIFQYYSLTPEEMDTEVHKYAAKLLDQKKVNEAWQLLLTTDII